MKRGFTFLGISVDFNKSYQIWINRGDDYTDRDYEGWSKLWFTEREIDDIKLIYGDITYRTVPFHIANITKNKEKFVNIGKNTILFIIGFVAGILTTYLL